MMTGFPIRTDHGKWLLAKFATSSWHGHPAKRCELRVRPRHHQRNDSNASEKTASEFFKKHSIPLWTEFSEHG